MKLEKIKEQLLTLSEIAEPEFASTLRLIEFALIVKILKLVELALVAKKARTALLSDDMDFRSEMFALLDHQIKLIEQD